MFICLRERGSVFINVCVNVRERECVCECERGSVY